MMVLASKLGIEQILVFRRLVSMLAVVLLVGACATGTPQDDSQWAASDSDSFSDDAGDPLETPNRFMFAFNEAMDTIIFHPAAATYRFILPNVVQDSVRNFTRNIKEPVVAANDLLQGKSASAGDTSLRFLINSTIGLAGLFDVATGMGYGYHKEDFGQTLGTWGAGEGAYLVLPVLGPSSIRDGVGLLVDQLFNPLTYLVHFDVIEPEVSLGISLAEGIDTRARNIETVEEIKRDAVDFYARVRSLYRQHRIDQINDGNGEGSPSPGLSGDEFQSSDAGWID